LVPRPAYFRKLRQMFLGEHLREMDYRSKRRHFVDSQNALGSSMPQCIGSAQGAGTALSNSVTPASLLPAAAKYTFPTNYFNNIGKVLWVRMTGQCSNVVTTPGTLTLDLRLGAVVVFNSGAMTLSTTAHTTLPIWWEVMLTLRAIGSGTSANFIGQSFAMGQPLSFTANADLSTSNSIGSWLAPNTTPAVGTGFDGTAVQQADVFGTFSVATSPTNFTLQQFVMVDMTYPN
jgi:hypothetical protein